MRYGIVEAMCASLIDDESGGEESEREWRADPKDERNMKKREMREM